MPPMKPQRSLYIWLTSCALLVGVAFPRLCDAEAAAEAPAPTSSMTPFSFADALSPLDPSVAAKSGDSTLPSKTTDFVTSLWQSLNLSSLWTANESTCLGHSAGGDFRGMVLGKILAISIQKISAGGSDAATKILYDLAGPANLALIALGITFGMGGLKWALRSKFSPPKFCC